jgi:transposase-like protein
VGNRSYSHEFRARAVALARVIGAEAASKQLGIGGRDTVRRWMAAAGDPPELQGTAEGWQTVLTVAQSQVIDDLANGKVRAKDAAVIAAIADRNLEKVRSRPEPEPDDANDLLGAWIIDHYPPHQRVIAARVVDAALEDESRRLDAILAGPDADMPDPGPEPDFLEWAQERITAVGDLDAWQVRYEAAEEAKRARERDIVRRADALRRETGMAYHDARQMAEAITP